jgi:molybdenum cofactor biosynthesis enzyme MoaA
VISALASLPLEKLGMTSNGFLLEPHLPLLKALGCDYLNISLDSLQAENFNRMTRSMGFEKVMGSILKAHEMGFQLKLNTVIMRGENDHELLDFVRFSEAKGIEVRFLELMKIGMARQFQPEAFYQCRRANQPDSKCFFRSAPLRSKKTPRLFRLRPKAVAKLALLPQSRAPFVAIVPACA